MLPRTHKFDAGTLDALAFLAQAWHVPHAAVIRMLINERAAQLGFDPSRRDDERL